MLDAGKCDRAVPVQGNPFGLLFRQAASKVGATCQEDSFDTSTVEVQYCCPSAVCSSNAD